MLTLAQAAILHWGLRPLRKLAQDVSELERGSSTALAEGYPAELQPLAANLNQLLNREQQQRERYRNTLADLAHSLKTPLAVLRQAATAEPPDRALLDEQIGRMDQLIGYQLQRAVTFGAHQLGQQQLRLLPLIEKLVASFEKVYFDKQLQFRIDIDPTYECRGDEGDLMEVLGNLLDNACKACRRQVAVSARSGERRLQISIEDDGPGIEPAQRRRILERGQRSDSYQPGQGIGLAVAVDILDSYGAELDIDHSQLGGARFTVRWRHH
jgi:two-component system sensor histidine kinase PhoQ